MANGNRIATDENLFHQQAQDLLTLSYIECLCSEAQFAAKCRQRLG